jgi:hypothetical protein
MLVSKAGACPRVEHLKPTNRKARLERPVCYKHLSLLWAFVNYGHNFFVPIVPNSSTKYVGAQPNRAVIREYQLRGKAKYS